MVDLARASAHELVYVAESAFGTTPTPNPVLLRLRSTGNGLNPNKNTLISAEQRTDGQVAFVRHGMLRAGGSIDFELSWLAMRDFLANAVRQSLSTIAAVSTAGAETAFAQATKTISRSTGSFVTDGFLAGMKFRVTGSTANDGVYSIVSVVTLAIVTTEALIDQVATPDVKMMGNLVQNGVVESSFTLEKRFTDVVLYAQATGCKVSGARLSVQPEAIITGSFDIMGQDFALAATLDAAPDDVDTAEPMDSYTGALLEAGAAIAVVSSLEFNINPNRKDVAVVAGSAVVAIDAGRIEVSGSLSAYFENATYINKFLNETATSLTFYSEDPAGNRFYVEIPAMKYTGGDLPVSGDDHVMVNLPWQAYRDATTGLTIRMNMVPAIAT